MLCKGWKYYNHAAIPTTAPHIEPDLEYISNGMIWNIDGKNPILARWVSEWDKKNEGNWWYVIKDTPFDIQTIKAKRRYEINKGRKNYVIREIDPLKYVDRIYLIQEKAFLDWPQKYRPRIDRNQFEQTINEWGKYRVFGAFSCEDKELYGFAYLTEYDTYIDFNVMRTMPECEKNGINAAIVFGLLEYYNEKIEKGIYLCDGSRSISHETLFQNYLEKYFEFRKVYCRLNLQYVWYMKWIVYFLYKVRKVLYRADGLKIVHKVNGIIRMEEIAREQHGK